MISNFVLRILTAAGSTSAGGADIAAAGPLGLITAVKAQRRRAVLWLAEPGVVFGLFQFNFQLGLIGGAGGGHRHDCLYCFFFRLFGYHFGLGLSFWLRFLQ